MQPRVPHHGFRGTEWSVDEALVKSYIFCVIMRLHLKCFKVTVMQHAKKLHPGGMYPDAVTSFKEMSHLY